MKLNKTGEGDVDSTLKRRIKVRSLLVVGNNFFKLIKKGTIGEQKIIRKNMNNFI